MQKVNVLFLGGAKRVSMAERLIGAGVSLHLDISLFSYELTDEVPIREIATVVPGRRWTDEDVIEHIVSVIEEKKIGILIPFVDPATVLAARIGELLPHLFVPGAPEELCGLFYNKRKAQDWFEANGFPVPVFSGGYPAIAKPVYGSASAGLHVLHDKQETDLFFQRHSDKDFLLQRYVAGEEYSVDCYAERDGKIIAVVPRLRIQTAGGEVIKSKTVDDNLLISVSEEIFKKAGLTGPVCIQFIKEMETDALFVLEINPRFGGGVIVSIEAGADMPFFLLNEYLGNRNEPVNDWQRGLLMMRAHREYFKALE